MAEWTVEVCTGDYTEPLHWRHLFSAYSYEAAVGELVDSGFYPVKRSDKPVRIVWSNGGLGRRVVTEVHWDSEEAT
jgi:hypothetical protein